MKRVVVVSRETRANKLVNTHTQTSEREILVSCLRGRSTVEKDVCPSVHEQTIDGRMDRRFDTRKEKRSTHDHGRPANVLHTKRPPYVLVCWSIHFTRAVPDTPIHREGINSEYTFLDCHLLC